MQFSLTLILELFNQPGIFQKSKKTRVFLFKPPPPKIKICCKIGSILLRKAGLVKGIKMDGGRNEEISSNLAKNRFFPCFFVVFFQVF